MGQTARGIISAPLTLSVILLSVVAWVWLRNQPASQRKPAILKLVLIAGVTMVALLAVKGRLHFVFALLALLFSLLRYCREQDEDSASAGGL
jgi:hypothetical protein